MGISQQNRDRIEDLGIDPGSDRTEDLRPRNAKAPEATGASQEEQPTRKLKGSSLQ